MRLFVGIALPEQLRFQLSLLCGGLPGVRWVPPENFHVTLRFVGEVDGGVMEDVDASLAGLRAPRFPLALAGVGHFGGGSQVRVIWAGVEKSPALRHLRDKVESAVVRAGLAPDGQKYSPHITLARPKSPPPAAKLRDFIVHNNLFRTPPFEVTHFTLFSSFATKGGSHYRAERSYELSRV
ncbi:MAG: RNA 2',3'-cyclic phosphodiesterase [Dongiaceae bacterium]